MTLVTRDRRDTASRTRRPVVVEPVDSPQSTSDGRTIINPPGVVRRPNLGSQIVRFGAIGVMSTLAWAGLYLLLRGAGLGSVAANAIALIVTAVGNTSANRRLTFGVSGREGLARDHGAGLVAFGLAMGLTTAAAALLARLAPGAGRPVELTVLAIANVVATSGRFVLLRSWVGRASPLRPI
jgi:putative flippase GtrA